MDAEVTSPWMGEGTSAWKHELERCLEQAPRIVHDCRDAGVRAMQDAKAEEQLSRVTQEHDSMDGGVRLASGTAIECPRMPKSKPKFTVLKDLLDTVRR